MQQPRGTVADGQQKCDLLSQKPDLLYFFANGYRQHRIGFKSEQAVGPTHFFGRKDVQ